MPDPSVGDLVEVRVSPTGHGRKGHEERGRVLAVYSPQRVAVQLPNWREEFAASDLRLIERAPTEGVEMGRKPAEIDDDTLREFARRYGLGERGQDIRAAMGLGRSAYERYRRAALAQGLTEPRFDKDLPVAAASWESQDESPTNANAPESANEAPRIDGEVGLAMSGPRIEHGGRGEARGAIETVTRPSEVEAAMEDLLRQEEAHERRMSSLASRLPNLPELAEMRDAAYKRVLAADRALHMARSVLDIYKVDEVPEDAMRWIWARFEAEVGE